LEGSDPAGLTPGAKYSPDQPRDEIGRWTTGGGSGDTRVAQGDRLSGYPVDLREEDRRGGHTIDQHVNVSYEALAERVQRAADAAVEQGDAFSGLSIGSFTSLDAATKLVNSTISDNADKVSAVSRGERPFAILEKHFTSPTGYEAYLDRRNAQPYERDTYGVKVLILRDAGSSKGYHVRTAFPVR